MYRSLSLPFSPHLSIDVAETWGPSLPFWSTQLLLASLHDHREALPGPGGCLLSLSRAELSRWGQENELPTSKNTYLTHYRGLPSPGWDTQAITRLSVSAQQIFFSPVGSLLPPQEASLKSSLLAAATAKSQLICRTRQTYPGFLLRQAFVDVPRWKSIMALTLGTFTLLVHYHQQAIDLYHLFGRKLIL